MRAGLAASLIGHAAIIGFGFVAFPEARPFTPPPIEALPVELVPVAEMTDLLQGDKSSEILPEEKPQPKPETKAEAPAPKPAEKPAEKPVEAARQPKAAPPPPPPPPEPERLPEPEPEPLPEPVQVAALPEPAEPEPPPPPEPAPEPLPKAEPSPEPPKPIESRLPKQRPKPPKPVAQPKPAPAPDPAKAQQPSPEEQDQLKELARAEAPDEEFNTEDIAALLDKQDPAGGGDPLPAPDPQTLGSIDGSAEAAMTQSELAALQARLYQCWNPPVGVREGASLVVTVRISLLQDGSLATAPQLLSVGSASDPLAQVAAESAIRAVAQCAPFGDILRPEKYALWRAIDFVFDPRIMLGG